MNELNLQIKSWLEANKENLIADTLETLKIDSESYNRVEVEKSLKQVLGIAERMGFRTELRANGEVGVVFFGEGDETLGILAHVDIVPVGDPKLWLHSPYGEISDGKIYGRGVVDNKGMVISSLYAMAATKALNIPTYKKVELIIGTREEIVWEDLDLYKKEGHVLPDYGFTPDAEFPIINREKGNCEIHMVFNGEDCPGEFEVLDIKSGEAVNSVPGRAYAKIRGDIEVLRAKAEDFNKASSSEKLKVEEVSPQEILITATGIEAHSSLPHLGDNAMTTICYFLSELKLCNTGVEKYVKFVADHFNGSFYGDSLELPVHPEFLNGEEMGKTTVVPSMAYTDNGIHLFLSIRTVFGTLKSEIVNALDTIGNRYSFSYSFLDYLEPLYVPREHKFIETLSKIFEESTGEKAEFILAGGTTYAKALPNSVAFGPTFPGDIDIAHQINEYISVDNFIKTTEIYALVTAGVLLSKGSLK